MTKELPITFITGASSGIGASLSIALAKKGHRVVLFSRNKEKLDTIKEKILENNGEALVIPGDVTDISSIEEAFKKVINKWGIPNFIIANAGVCHWVQTSEMNIKDAHSTINVNLIGLINVVQTAIPLLIKNKGGHIVGISSVASYRGFPNFAVYSASKAGVVKYLDAVRVENYKKGIIVSTICPGFIETPMVTDMDIPKWVPKPFLLSNEESTRRIIKAIEKKKSHYAYPLPWALLGKLGVIMPNLIYVRVVIPFARWWYS
jgi:short-subunit dehydrogenase